MSNALKSGNEESYRKVMLNAARNFIQRTTSLIIFSFHPLIQLRSKQKNEKDGNKKKVYQIFKLALLFRRDEVGEVKEEI